MTVETDAGAYEAGQVIVAVPPTLAGRIDYQPALPARRDQLTQQLPHGQVIKVMVAYDEPWWRAEGLNGQAASAIGPVGITFDNTVPGHDPGILVGFYEGNHALYWGEKSPTARRQAFIDCLVRYFGPKAASPIDYVERDWTAEPWTRAATAPTSPPVPGPASAPPCASPSVPSTGPAPRRPPGGWATSTAPSNPLNVPSPSPELSIGSPSGMTGLRDCPAAATPRPASRRTPRREAGDSGGLRGAADTHAAPP